MSFLPLLSAPLRRAAVATAGAVVTGGAGVGYGMYNRNLNWGRSHYYKTDVDLGPNEAHGSPAEVLNGFPGRISGDMDAEGRQAQLSFFGESPNTVQVQERSPSRVKLQAVPGKHLFEGTADHSVSQNNDRTTWTVKGRGPKGKEAFGMQILNVVAGKVLWPMVLPRAPQPATEAEQVRSASVAGW